MSNSLNSIPNQTYTTPLINQEIIDEDNTIDNNPVDSFTEAKITLNPEIFNKLDLNNEVTIQNIIVAKNKVIETLSNTNKNLTNIIVNCTHDSINTNKYIDELSEKLNDQEKIADLSSLLKEEQFEHENLKVAYSHITKEYLTLKKTYTGLNRIYVDNIVNYFYVAYVFDVSANVSVWN